MTLRRAHNCGIVCIILSMPGAQAEPYHVTHPPNHYINTSGFIMLHLFSQIRPKRSYLLCGRLSRLAVGLAVVGLSVGD